MSGSTRTVQVTMGIRQLGAAILAVALAAGVATALAFGQLTAPNQPTNAGAVPTIERVGTGGHNGAHIAS